MFILFRIQNGIFFDVGLSVDPLDPPSYPLEAGSLAIPAYGATAHGRSGYGDLA